MAFLFPTERLADNLYVRLFEARWQQIDAHWRAADVLSSYWRLYLNEQPGAALVLPDRLYRLAAREVHFVPAWVRFTCRCDRPVAHFFIHFDAVGLPGEVVRTLFGGPVSIGEQPAVSALAEALRGPLGAAEGGLGVLCRLKALVHTALAALFEQLDPAQAARCGGLMLGECAVAPALRYIEEHLAAPLKNAQLAELCRLSEDHFIRRFRETVSQTPAQFIAERRVSRAAQLLVFTPESIERIAAQTGFSNRHYFTRVFATRMGVPPAAYRRAARASEGVRG